LADIPRNGWNRKENTKRTTGGPQDYDRVRRGFAGSVGASCCSGSVGASASFRLARRPVGPTTPAENFHCPYRAAGHVAPPGRGYGRLTCPRQPPPCRLALSAGGGEDFSPALLDGGNTEQFPRSRWAGIFSEARRAAPCRSRSAAKQRNAAVGENGSPTRRARPISAPGGVAQPAR